jgi:hypothetical protein
MLTERFENLAADYRRELDAPETAGQSSAAQTASDGAASAGDAPTLEADVGAPNDFKPTDRGLWPVFERLPTWAERTCSAIRLSTLPSPQCFWLITEVA